MADSRKLLWMVTRSYAPDEGGVQTYAQEVAKAYVELGWHVTLFAKSSAGPRRECAGGITLIDVGPGSKARTYFRLSRAMRRESRTGMKAALIHACTWRAALPALLFRARLIVTVHGREIGRTKGTARFLMRGVLRRADRIVAVSDATRSLLLKRLPGLAAKCMVAWNGTSLSTGRTEPVRPDGAARVAQVFTLCRLVPRKNVVNAVAAIGRCVRQGHALEYRIGGRGPEADNVVAEIMAQQLAGHVRYLGYLSPEAIEDLYSGSDIFLHPQVALEDGAEIEGFGITVADAMARGVVCIVGAEGGPSELIEDGVTGLIVDGRRIESIADALETLVRSPDRRAVMGENAKRWAADNLGWATHCRAVLA